MHDALHFDAMPSKLSKMSRQTKTKDKYRSGPSLGTFFTSLGDIPKNPQVVVETGNAKNYIECSALVYSQVLPW